jgi:hypothetical protein
MRMRSSRFSSGKGGDQLPLVDEQPALDAVDVLELAARGDLHEPDALAARW